MASKKKPKIPAPPVGLGAAALNPPGSAIPNVQKGISPGQRPLPPPPPGTYDSVLDYNAGAATRGLTQTQNDAQTLFEQGQEDYGLGLGDLTRGRDWALADLATGEHRLTDDYWRATGENTRQYGILGRQQAEGAAQRGVTSAGLLGRGSAVRGENQARDQAGLDLSKNRGIEDIGTQRGRTNTNFDQGKLRLDLGNARQFGGFNGAVINNPLTNSPYTGQLATGVQRAFTENEAYQGGILGQKIDQARAGGFVSPLLTAHPGILTPKPGDPGYEEYLRHARTLQGQMAGR